MLIRIWLQNWTINYKSMETLNYYFDINIDLKQRVLALSLVLYNITREKLSGSRGIHHLESNIYSRTQSWSSPIWMIMMFLESMVYRKKVTITQYYKSMFLWIEIYNFFYNPMCAQFTNLKTAINSETNRTNQLKRINLSGEA